MLRLTIFNRATTSSLESTVVQYIVVIANRPKITVVSYVQYCVLFRLAPHGNNLSSRPPAGYCTMVPGRYSSTT